jgi:hypothetical protein
MGCGLKGPKLLNEHGFVQTNYESLAETTARPLGMTTQKLAACIAQGRIGSALLERFAGLNTFREYELTGAFPAGSRFLEQDFPIFDVFARDKHTCG